MRNAYYYRVNVRKLVEDDKLMLEPHVEVMLFNGERWTGRKRCAPDQVKKAMRTLCSEADTWIRERTAKE